MQVPLENISLSDLHIGERFRKDYGDMEQFKYSIKSKGLITPIAVGLTEKLNMEGLDTSKKYTLLAGGRRTEACIQLKMLTVPARIYDSSLNELDLRAIELAENLDRKDMSFVEECALKKQVHELQESIHGKKVAKSPQAPGWSQADTAKLLKESPNNVSRDIKLAQAIEQFPQLGLDKCKNKSDAMKLLKKAGTQLAVGQAAEQFQQTMKKSGRLNQMVESYIIGDCFTTMKAIPDNSINLVEIDPPYAMDLHAKKSESSMLGYNEIDSKKYVNFMQQLFTESYRILRDGGWMICWFAMDPWYETLANLIDGANFKFNRLPGIWAKPNGQCSQPQTSLASTYEPFFYCRKGNGHIEKMGRSNVFAFNPVAPAQKWHPTQRPLNLMEEILMTFTRPNSTVYIPFLGSGTTLLAANNCQCKAFGNDLTKEFKDGYVVALKEMIHE